MPSKKITAMPDLAGAQVPTDLLTAVDLSEPVATQNVKTTFNDTFAEITKNVTDLSVQWANGNGTATVSAANKGKIIYNSTVQSFQVSENGGAYENLVKGSGANTRVAYWTAVDTLSSDSAFLWDATNDRLLINVAVASGAAPIDVLADGSAIGQQWRENAGATRVQLQVPSGFGQIGTTTNDDFGIITNSVQHLNVEATGAVVCGNVIVATATLMSNAIAATDIALIANNATLSSVDIARFQVNGSNRFRFTQLGEAILGLASTLDGKLTLTSAGAATLQSLQAGTAPAATNTFRWPNADPTAGQALTASAPAAGVVTLSWTTVGGGGTPSAPDGSIQFNNGGAFDGDAGLLWDTANQQMLVGGIALAAGQAPIDVVADGSAIAQQWREAGAGTARVQMQIPASFGQLGTISAHDFAILSNNAQRINVESGGAVVIGAIVAATAELMVNSLADGSISLIANNTTATSVDIARFQVNTTNRFRFLNTGEAIFGTASANSGKLTFQASGNANIQSIQAADSPASNLIYKLPTADPTTGQVLSAAAPAAGISVLSWASVGTVTGSGVATRVAFWTSASALGSNANLFWDNTNDRLGVGTATPGLPLDVVSDALAAAQQWRETGGGATRVQMLVPSGFGLFGTSTNDDMGFMANNIQYVNIEATGGTVFGSIVPATGTVMVNALTNSDVAIVGNNASGSTNEILLLQVAGSNRFRLLATGEAIFGLASTVTGKLTLSNASGATLTSISAGNAASTLNFIWPVADPTAGQVLSAAAPVAGDVVLSWATASGGATINPTDNVMPVRQDATTFIDSNISLVAGVTAVTSANAAAFAVGASGNTNPVFRVVGNVASQATGLSITGNAAASGVDLTVLSSGTNEPLRVATKGNGGIAFATNLAAFTPASTTFHFRSSGTSGGSPAGTVVIESNGSNDGNNALNISTAGANNGILFTNAGNVKVQVGYVLVAPSTASVTGFLTVLPNNAATNTLVNIARLGVNSTGTAAAGFGGILSFSAESSTTNDQQVAADNWFWNDATHATRTGALSWSVTNNASLTEYMRLTTAGGGGTFVATAACLTVHDGTAPLIWTAGNYAAKLYLIGASGTPASGVVANFSATTTAAPTWIMLRGRGTNASPTAVQTADVLGELEWWGQFNTSTNNVVAGCRIRAVSTETWSSGLNGSGLFFYTSPTGGVITLRASLENTGTLRLGATSGTFNTTTLLQVGNYASWNTDVVGAIYTGANGTKGLEVIGTASQTADLFRVFRDTVTPDLFKVQSVLGTVVRVGLGTNAADYAYVGGNIKTNTTAASNTGTGQTDLITYSLRASCLGTNGDYVEVDAWGTFAANGNNKQVTMEFGGTTIFDTSALIFNGTAWRIRAKIVRTGATTQIAIAGFDGDITTIVVNSAYSTPGETLSNAITIKCTGTGGASTDITQEGMTVKWYPNGQ